MTFFLLVVTIFKGILFLIVHYIVWTKILVIGILMCFYFYTRKYLNKPKVVTLLSYKLNRFYECLFAVMLFSIYLALIFGNLLISRILNIGSKIDLRIWWYQIQFYIVNTPVMHIVLDTLLTFFCILCLLKVYILCKRVFKKEFIKLNIYGYYKFKDFGIVTYYALYYETFPAMLIYKHLTEFVHVPIEALLRIKFVFKNLGIICLIVCLLYDLIFNNFVLSKIYYVFPFVLLYTQWQLFGSFYMSRDLLVTKF